MIGKAGRNGVPIEINKKREHCEHGEHGFKLYRPEDKKIQNNSVAIVDEEVF